MNFKQPITPAGMNMNMTNIQQSNPLPINPNPQIFPGFPINFNPNINMNMGMINPMLNQMMPPSQIPILTPNANVHPHPHSMPIPMSMPLPMMMNIPMMMSQMQKPLFLENKKVWVSKIPENVSDTFMLKLLEACGPVNSWKRVTDSRGKLNSFGICEYQTVESMLKCLRILNNFQLEDSELQIKVGSETEEFLKKWRERKKEDWIESLRLKGFQVDLDEVKKKEANGEPLDWELQLISKDQETHKLLYEIMSQRTEIETYARQSERPEQYLKDLKELAQGSLSQHFESERERERGRIQAEKIKKMEKMFRDEEKKWEKHEDDRDREKSRRKYERESYSHQKKKLIEKDLNYDSDIERKKISQNSKRYEEHLQVRLKEKEYDDMMRRREYGDDNDNNEEGSKQRNQYNNNALTTTTTDIAIIEDNEPKAKTQIQIEEYKIEEDNRDNNNNDNTGQSPKDILQLNIVSTVKPVISNAFNHSSLAAIIDDEDNDDPYHQKNKISHIEINTETERQLIEMSKDIKCQINSSDDDQSQSQSKHTKTKGKAKANAKQPLLNQVPSDVLRDIQKNIIEQIPKERDDILKYPINWSIVDDYQIKRNKLRPWLEKKLVEYFDEDASFTNLLIDKIGKFNPYEIFDTLKQVLEEDAEDFMCKMWKNLIFETLKVEKILKYQSEIIEDNKVIKEEKDTAK